MLDFIGSHYDWLAGLATVMFTIILAAASVDDALRRRREGRGASPASAENEVETAEVGLAA